MSCSIKISNPVGDVGEFYQPGSLYGWRKHPVTGELTIHHGLDIPAPTGTKVRSVLPGIVSLSQFSDTAGNYIIIEHPNGIKSKYMHLNSLLVQKGDQVKQGDPIGTIGSTGRVTGPHLHFELHQDNKPINPFDCYMASQFVNPYLPDKFNWIPLAIGSGIVLTAFGIWKYRNR